MQTRMQVRKRKNRYVGQSLSDYVAEEKARRPEFATEFDRLQLARKIRETRERAKLSQNDVATKAGTKQSAIARLESGRVVPKLDLLAKVARALGKRLEVRFVEK